MTPTPRRSHTSPSPPPAPALRWVLTVLCLGVVLAQVDTSIVLLATQAIGAHFRASVAALQWVVDGYNLSYAVLLLSGGLLADLKGRRRTFMAGVALFTGASLLCAWAPSVQVLVLGRALAGVGAACLIPASLALVRVVWPEPDARNRVLGIWAASNGLALAIGPSLGGLLLRHLGWRSVFFAVVPLGVLTLLGAWAWVPESADAQGRDFDVGAQVLAGGALAGLAIAAIHAREQPWLAGVAALLALLALAGFVAVERTRGARALVPLDTFRLPAFSGAALVTVAMTFGMYGALFLLPLEWQASGRLSAQQAGLALLPMALVFVLVSPFSGALTRRLGARVQACAGSGVIALGLLTVGWGGTGSASAAMLGGALLGLALTGLGMGLATAPLMGMAVGAVPPARAGTASALINVARMVGATLGVALLGMLYASAGGGAHGLRLAMTVGAVVQGLCVALGWRVMGAADGADRRVD